MASWDAQRLSERQHQSSQGPGGNACHKGFESFSADVRAAAQLLEAAPPFILPKVITDAQPVCSESDDGCATYRSADELEGKGAYFKDSSADLDAQLRRIHTPPRAAPQAFAIHTPQIPMPAQRKPVPIHSPNPSPQCSAPSQLITAGHALQVAGRAQTWAPASTAQLSTVERAELAVERLRWAVTEAAAALGSLIDTDEVPLIPGQHEKPLHRRAVSADQSLAMLQPLAPPPHPNPLPQRPSNRRHSSRSVGKARGPRHGSQESDGADEADGEEEIKARAGSLKRGSSGSFACRSSGQPSGSSRKQRGRRASMPDGAVQLKQDAAPPIRPVPGNLDLRTRSEGPHGRSARTFPLVSLDAFLGETVSHQPSLESFLGEHVPKNPFSRLRA